MSSLFTRTLPLSAIAIICTSLLSGCDKHYETVDAIPFADQNFRTCVLEANEQYSEDITELDCDNSDIKSVDELKYFENLRELSLKDNQLAAIDLTNNPELRAVNLADNEIQVLDLSENENLRSLVITENELETLDVSANSKLEKLLAGNNQLENVVLSKKKPFRTTCAAIKRTHCFGCKRSNRA